MGRNLFPLYMMFILLTSILLSSASSWAGRVVKVSGKKVLIILDANEVSSTKKGDKLLLSTPGRKKKALVMVRNMKGNKVIAQLGKGKAARGLVSAPYTGKKKNKPRESRYESASEIAKEEISSPSSSKHENLRFGVLGNFGTATQNVVEKADMSGSLMGVKGLVDYSLFESLGVRGRFGVDMFSVTGTGAGINYQTDINYLTVDILARYNIVDSSSFGLFVNGGVGIYSPLSSELSPAGNAALDESSISTTSLLILGAGVSFPIGGMELFLGADYLYFPPSDDVTTSAISAKVGLLFAL